MNKFLFKLLNFFAVLLFLLIIFFSYLQFYAKPYLIEKELVIDPSIQEIEEVEKTEPENKVKVLNIYHYAYNFLNEEEQETYNIILEKSLNHLASFSIKPIDESSLSKIFTAVLNDNPEHFWLNNLKYYVNTSNQKVTKLELMFTETIQTRAEKQAQIDKVVGPLLIEINKLTTNYDKVKYVYDYITSNTIYDLKVIDQQNIYSVLVNHRGVCAGYAKSFQYLMNKVGIQSLYITGKIIALENDNNIGHAWNMIRLNNQYYHIDVTWGNASFSLEKDQANLYNNYHYFNIKDEDLFKTHKSELFYPLPKADSINENYYYKENLLFDDYNNQLNTKILETIINLNNQKNQFLTFKFTNEEAYRKAYTELLNNRGIFKLIRRANEKGANKINDNNIRYYKADNHLIIDIILNYQ